MEEITETYTAQRAPVCLRLADYAQFGSVDRIPFDQLVYGGLCAGFGDAVIYLNVVRHFHAVTRLQVRLSRWTIRKCRDRRAVYGDLLSAFELSSTCQLCDCHPTANIDHLNPLITTRIVDAPIEFLRSPVRWRGGDSDFITYQFDGTSFGDLKAPSADDVELLVSSTRGYKMVCLGKQFSVEENLALLAQSKCFIGVDSGIAQLAYSVGVPMFLMRNRHFFEPNHAPNMGREAFIGDSAGEIVPSLASLLKGESC